MQHGATTASACDDSIGSYGTIAVATDEDMLRVSTHTMQNEKETMDSDSSWEELNQLFADVGSPIESLTHDLGNEGLFHRFDESLSEAPLIDEKDKKILFLEERLRTIERNKSTPPHVAIQRTYLATKYADTKVGQLHAFFSHFVLLVDKPCDR